MSWFSILQSAQSLIANNRTEKPRRREGSAKGRLPKRLGVERLDERIVLSTFSVVNLDDSGAGSLRQAIVDSNAKPGADLIRFAPAARDGAITLSSGELAITDDLRIDGPGADRLTVSGNDSSRVFRIASGAAVNIDDLTVTHGRAVVQGGGILNAGSLTLSRVMVSENEVVGIPGASVVVDAFGGGIFNSGSLAVSHSRFVDNRSLGADGAAGIIGTSALGGAIMSGGSAIAPATATVSYSTFVDNRAIAGAAGAGASRAGIGGAISNAIGTMNISHSVFRDNHAVGGIDNGVPGGFGAGSGGAIANVARFGNAILSVSDSNLTNNQAIGGAGNGVLGQDGRGGAIANYVFPGLAAPVTVSAMWNRKLIHALTSASAQRRTRRPQVTRLRIETLENRRMLAFSPFGEYGVGLNPAGLVSADFNADGRLDLATNSVGLGIGTLLGNGDATFQPAQYSGTLSNDSPVLARDLNGDAKIDLVTINENDRNLRVLLGNGDGTFQSPLQGLVLPSQLPPGSPNAHPHQAPISVGVGDLNADGILDLVAAGYDLEEVVFWEVYRQHDYANVLLGNGDGTFGPGTAYHVASTDNTIAKPSVLEVRDFDSDGKSDVLMSVQSSELVLMGNGDGTLQTPPRLSWFEYQAGADVNADGIEDSLSLVGIVVYYSDSGANTTRTARVQLGNSDGSMAPPIVSELGTVQAASYFESRVLADFDGDGAPDLAVIERRYPESGIPFGVVTVAGNDGNWSLPAPVPPTITISDATIVEGNTGTRASTFSVMLSAASTLPVTVSYAAANATAIAGSDYQATSGLLTIPAGQTEATISVLVKGDRVPESNETFVVNLSNPMNATIADGQGVGTIVDDEPRLSISDVTQAEGRKGTTSLFTFTVTLSAAYDQPVTVSFKTVNGTAKTSNSDYVAKSGTLTFAPGETSKTVTITVRGDSKKEGNETFYLNLFTNSSNSQLKRSRGMGTILSDD